MKHKSYALVLALIVLALGMILPQAKVEAAAKKILVITMEDGEANAYKNLAKRDGDNKLIIDVKSLAKKLDLTYKSQGSGKFTLTDKEDDIVCSYKKGTTKYTAKADGESESLKGQVKVTLDSKKKYWASYKALAPMKECLYIAAADAPEYKANGYAGVLIYSDTEIDEDDLPAVCDLENAKDAGLKEGYKLSKKHVSVQKDKVELGIDDSVRVQVKCDTRIWYNIEDTDIVSCKWLGWNESTKEDTLQITAKGEGETRVYITNDVDNSKVYINVKVKSALDVEVEIAGDLLMDKGYSDTDIQLFTLDDVRCEATYYSYSNEYTLEFFMEGTKTKDYNNDGESRYISIPWKLYNKKNNAVVDSGNVLTPDLQVGDYFAEANGYAFDLKKGSYKLVVGVEADPTLPENPDFLGTGEVRAHVTYKYNKVIGTRGDDGAKVILIPKDPKVKEFDNNAAVVGVSGVHESGIVVGKCNEDGDWERSEVQAGDYVALIISRNCNTMRSSESLKAELTELVGDYLSAEDLDTLAVIIGLSELAYDDDLQVRDGYRNKLNHDFGYTDI